MSLFDRVIFVSEFVKIKFTNLVLFIIKKYIKFYNETDYLLLNNYNHMAQTVFGLLTCTDVTIYVSHSIGWINLCLAQIIIRQWTPNMTQQQEGPANSALGLTSLSGCDHVDRFICLYYLCESCDNVNYTFPKK